MAIQFRYMDVFAVENDNVRIDEHALLRWLVFNVGEERCQLSLIDSNRDKWQGVTNRKWHGASSSILNDVIFRAIESGIFLLNNGVLEITESGQNLWENWFKPDWKRAYDWSFDSTDDSNNDLHIKISAASDEVLCRILATGFTADEYQYVVPESVKYFHEYFRPLYWKELQGPSVCFAASFRTDRPILYAPSVWCDLKKDGDYRSGLYKKLSWYLRDY